MALNLNKPSDFLTPKASDMPKEELLPPSAFEKPSCSALRGPEVKVSGAAWTESPGVLGGMGGVVWRGSPGLVGGERQAAEREQSERQLTEANNRILRLQQENEHLRSNAARQISIPAHEEIRARVDVHKVARPAAAAHARQDISYYDDILQRQAAEIAELKKNLVTSQAEYQKTFSDKDRLIARLEGQSDVKHSQYSQQIESIQAQVAKLTENNKLQMLKLQEEHEQLLTSREAVISELTSKLQVSQNDLRQLTTESQNSMAELREKLQASQNECQNIQRSKEKEVEMLTQQIGQLKKYIGESEGARSVELWKQQIQALNAQNKLFTEEKDKLEKSVDLMNIRLNSQNSILTVQEQILSKAKEENEKSEKTKQTLLTRWREKVYTVMVQSKCSELSFKDEERKLLQKITGLEDSMIQCRGENQVLEHAVRNKDAELQIERQQVKALQYELTRAQEVALTLDDRLQEDNTCAQMLAQSVISLQEKYNESEARLKSAMSVVQAYHQRLAFACSRLQMLQGQFARREARLRLVKEEEIPTRDSAENSTLHNELEKELDRVTRERDQLANQLREDAQFLDNKVSFARQQVADEVQQLKSRIQELHAEIEDKSEKILDLTSRLETSEKEIIDAQENVEILKESLAKQQSLAEKGIQNVQRELEETYTQQLTDMERKVNDSRREQTKAVVSLRQLERQMGREREKYKEQIQNTEEQNQQLIERLKQQLQTVEKERNICMATLRQEGLLGQLRAQRPDPITLPQEAQGETEAPPTVEAVVAVPPEGGDSAEDEPLHAVIDDLKALTTSVLDSDDSDGEDDSLDGKDEADAPKS